MKLNIQFDTNAEAQPVALLNDARRAFAAAQSAQSAWAATPLRHRLQLLRRTRNLIAQHATKLALAATVGNDRPVSEALAAQVLPLADAIRFLEHEAGSLLATRRLGRAGRPAWLAGTDTEIHREPLGVVLVIAPSNYPLLLPGVQVLQALAAGNAVLLKPGAQGSPAALALAGLLQTAGLDPRLLAVLPDSVDAGRVALDQPVAKVFFTGSFTTGTEVLAQLARHAIPATVELSGSDAVIVRDDVELDLVVDALLFGLRFNGSATCIAPRRVFVVRRVAEQLEARLQAACSHQKFPSLQPRVAERLGALVAEAEEKGAHLLTGRTADHSQLTAPVIVAGAQPTMRLLREDFFAPVLSLVTVDDDEAAIQLAADCPYALGATIFSRDIAAARKLALQLPGGVVVINDMIVPTADPRIPFGGRRHSGFGVTRGTEGLIEMTVPKVVIHRRGKSRPHFAEAQAGDEEFFRSYIETAHGEGWFRRLTSGMRFLGQLIRKARSSRH